MQILSIIYRTQTTLRHILGSKVLQECVENRDSIAHEVQEITGRVAAEWGVKVIINNYTEVSKYLLIFRHAD